MAMIPGNMTTPKLKLADGEAIEASADGLRKKGIFGNRYGQLHVTNQRVAFVKSTMKAGLVGLALNAGGAKAMLSFERKALKVETLAHKKLRMLQLSDGTTSEKFWLSDADVERLAALLS